MKHILTEEQLFEVELPEATDTYAPVSHHAIVSKITESLLGKDMVIKDKKYLSNNEGQQLIGTFTIETERPSTANSKTAMDMMIAFRNSYDKSMSVGFAAGTRVWICENGMISGDIQMVRKHTGNVLGELVEKIDTSIDTLGNTYAKLTSDAHIMSNIELEPKVSAELLGRLFIDEDIITSTQLNIIKNELSNSKHFKEDSMWDLYNHCTEAMKKSHASRYLPGLISLHDFFQDEVSLITS